MSVTKITNKKSKHYNEYRVRAQPRDAAGNTVSLPVKYCKTKTEANKVYQKLMVDFERESTFYKDKDLNLVDSYTAYLESENRAGSWEKRTYNDHLYTLHILEQYLPNIKLKNVDENVMRLFARKLVSDKDLSVAYNTVMSRRFQHLRTYFSRLVGTIYKQNPVPARFISRWFRKGEMSPKKKKYTFSTEQINVLKKYVISRINKESPQQLVSLVGVLICLSIGCRPGEVQALKWEDLTVEKTEGGSEFNIFCLSDSWNELEGKMNGHLKSRMPGQTRNSLPLNPQTVDALRTFQEKQARFLKRYNLPNKGCILLSLRDFKKASEGKVINQKAVNEALKKACQVCEIDSGELPISIYTCRHSVATLLCAKNINPAIASSRLGNSIEVYLKKYVHPSKDIIADSMNNWLEE